MVSKLTVPELPDVPTIIQSQSYETYEYFQKIKEMFDSMLGRSELQTPLIAVQGKQGIKNISADYVVSVHDFGKTIRTFGFNAIKITLPSVGTDYDGYRITIIKGGTGNLTIQVTGDRYIEESALGGSIRCTTSDKEEVITLEYNHSTKIWSVISSHGWTHFAEIYVEDGSASQTLTDQNTWYQLTQFDTNGSSNGCTPDHTNDHIIVHITGKFICNLAMAFSGSNSSQYEIKIKRNNGTVETGNLSTERMLGAGGDIGSVSISGIASLTKDDTVEVWVRCTSGASKTISAVDVNLMITRIH